MRLKFFEPPSEGVLYIHISLVMDIFASTRLDKKEIFLPQIKLENEKSNIHLFINAIFFARFFWKKKKGTFSNSLILRSFSNSLTEAQRILNCALQYPCLYGALLRD